MSDPLSLAASIAGLMSLADVVFRAVFKYARAVKDSKSDIEALSTEINFLGTDLRHLYALASELEAEKDTFEPTLRIHHLGHCDKTLTKIKKRVTKASDSFARSKLSSVARQLKWPFSSSETKELLDDVSRYKQAIHVALSADTMRKLQLALSKTEELSAQVASVENIVKRIEINTQIDIDAKRQKILDYFMEVSPRSRLDMSVKLRHAMTGLWLTESPGFQQWLETPDSMLWLSGIPGAGKTVLAGAVVQEALSRSHRVKDVAVGYFFCDYKDSATGIPTNILGALAHQLARQKPEAFDILCDYYDELHPPNQLPQKPDSDELRSKIGSMTELFDQAIIIVDGLDECDDNTDDVVEILVQLAEYSINISMALFSRDHFDIRIQLEETFKHVQISAHADDIRLYVGEALERRIQTNRLQISSIEVRDEIMETLVREAKGMFRWVVCQLDYLSDCSHDQERLEALKKLPPNLPESYRRLLERLESCSPGVKRMVQMCLQFIAFAIEPLTVIQLRQAISTPETLGSRLDTKNTVSEQDIVRRCSSLIRKSEDEDYFEFAHFSVKEFLLDKDGLSGTADRPSLEAYWISETGAKDLLAAQCLRFLQLENFNQQPAVTEQELVWIGERNDTYPFYVYSASQWLRLTADGLQNEQVCNLANSLFDPMKTTYFTNWTVWIYVEIIAKIDSKCKLSETDYLHVFEDLIGHSWRPIHMASALNLPEICRSIIRQDSSHNSKFKGFAPIDLAIVSIFGTLEAEILSIRFSMLHSDIMENTEVFDDLFFHFSHFLSSTERRNQTIDILTEEGGIPSSDLPPPNAFFFVTCNLSYGFGDLSPVTRLLVSGKVPTDSEVAVFEACLGFDGDSRERAIDSATMEKSMLELLQTLQSETSFQSNWSLELGQIVWKLALRLDYSFTENPLVIDSRISLSEEALVESALAAISYDNDEQLRKCLSDGRLGLSSSISVGGQTILHKAASFGLPRAIQLLLDTGCDPLISDSYGDLPVHKLVLREDFVEAVRIFAENEVSLLSTNRDGCTIWHLLAKDNPTAILEYFSKTGSAIMANTLSTRNHAGETALSLIFENDRSECEGVFINLAKLCANIPGFWHSHGPIFGAAARWGSESIIRFLLVAGAESEPAPAGTCSPLHNLPSSSSLEYVKLLQQLYPGAHEHRFEGRLPAELYIRRTYCSEYEPQLKIIECLTSPTACSSFDEGGHTLWEYVCLLTRIGGVPRAERLDQAIDICIRLGVMAAYEDQKNESGLIPLLVGLLDLPHATTYISVNTLCSGILSTRFWPSSKTSEAVVRFLKAGVKDLNLEVVQALLWNDVNVHQRVDELSVIEFACQEEVALKVCGSEDGRCLINQLLDHANTDQLNEATPDEEGLRLLHRTATQDYSIGISWLVKELIQRGVSVNEKMQGGYKISALAHHVLGESYQLAELLLELGADPSVDSEESSLEDCTTAAVLNGNAGFLKKLLAHNVQCKSTMAWGKTVGCHFHIRGAERYCQGLNALHLATKNLGAIECLNFYLEQSLLTDVNAASFEGFTPLHFAAACNSLEAMDVLVENGANITAECNEKSTPLHVAAQNGHLAAVRLLVQHDAVPTPDIFRKTARAYAVDGGHTDIVDFLDEAFGHDACITVAKDDSPPSKRQMQALSRAFQQAIRDDDVESCKRLVDSGCPIDIVFPGGYTALLFSMTEGRQEIAKWLISQGANVRKAMFLNDQWVTAIELVCMEEGCEFMITQLLDEYIRQGGDLVHGDDSPLHQAAKAGNAEGLRKSLECIEERIGAIARRSQLAREQVLLTILNRGIGDDQRTPLHIGVQEDNRLIVSILVEKGANINVADKYGNTPFDMAISNEMCNHLAAISACDTSRYSRILTTSIDVWAPMLPLGNEPQALLNDKSELSNLKLAVRQEICGLQMPIRCDEPEETFRTTPAWPELDVDLTQEDWAGRSVMHHLICKEDPSDLVFGNDAVIHTSPFPWHLDWFPFDEIAFLTSKFLVFQTQLPRETFRNILNLEPNRGWSPLCLGAYYNLVGILENCLSMGAEIDYEGSPLGSALVVACALGKLDSVKFLVRRQASVSYPGKRGRMNVMELTRSEPVKAWLLVGRFNEQLRIGTFGSPTESSCEMSFAWVHSDSFQGNTGRLSSGLTSWWKQTASSNIRARWKGIEEGISL
ncbi:hypothetical protein B0J13DRAFT_605634 [Dactylonectria estremocensis]|uniref:Nephrocystin 3-like N-terminal domain-containing protein n=1 Tax=Dactylonectria estremocensis TaxID=1079267 RepID=A0A9P9F140_9HYPO|nr:hypothetical protein B0J13DRAFT_605634 [Dactylonectria estremocensis]